jgi:hypothetical protein
MDPTPTIKKLDGKFTDTTNTRISSGTIFATIDLGIGPQENKYKKGDMVPTPTLTAIYLPEKYHPESQVNVLVYLHGHKREDLVRGSIEDILAAPGYKFRDQIAKTGKNFVLVAPTLGTKAQSGDLMTSGGAETYLGVVMKALSMGGPHSTTPDVGNIVVAAHSGAGLTLLAILQQASMDFRKKITECWGFDCLYGIGDPVPAPQPPQYKTTGTTAKLDQRNAFLKAFSTWEKAQATKAIEKQLYDLTGFCKFFVYWTQQGGTQTRTKNLDLLAKRYYPFNSVEVSPPFYELDADGDVVAIDPKKKVLPGTLHDDVPKTFLPGRVEASSSLS